MLCEAKTGYIFDHTGQGNEPVTQEQGPGHKAARKLLGDEYTNAGNHLFVDNFYSSPVLFNDLKKRDDPLYFQKGDLMASAWHVTAEVNFISTIVGKSKLEQEILSEV